MQYLGTLRSLCMVIYVNIQFSKSGVDLFFLKVGTCLEFWVKQSLRAHYFVVSMTVLLSCELFLKDGQ
jgi:hypothetical protein